MIKIKKFYNSKFGVKRMRNEQTANKIETL